MGSFVLIIECFNIVIINYFVVLKINSYFVMIEKIYDLFI